MSDQNFLIKQPLGYGALLDLTLSLYKRFFFQAIGFGLLCIGLPKVLLYMLANLKSHESLDLVGILLATFMIFLGTVFAYIALVKAVKQVCMGDPLNWKSVLTFSKKNFWKIFFAGIVTMLWCSLCLICFIIPGIIALLNAFLINVVMVVEETSLKKSWKRSKELVRGNKWRIIFICLAYNLSMFLFIYLSGFLLEELFPNSFLLIYRILENIGCILFFPLVPIFLTVLYYDICVRKEGLDLAFECQDQKELPA